MKTTLHTTTLHTTHTPHNTHNTPHDTHKTQHTQQHTPQQHTSQQQNNNNNTTTTPHTTPHHTPHPTPHTTHHTPHTPHHTHHTPHTTHHTPHTTHNTQHTTHNTHNEGNIKSGTLMLMPTMKLFEISTRKKRTNMKSGSPSKWAIPNPCLVCPPRPEKSLFYKRKRHFYNRNFSTIVSVFSVQTRKYERMTQQPFPHRSTCNYHLVQNDNNNNPIWYGSVLTGEEPPKRCLFLCSLCVKPNVGDI